MPSLPDRADPAVLRADVCASRSTTVGIVLDPLAGQHPHPHPSTVRVERTPSSGGM